MTHFAVRGEHIVTQLSDAERAFLSDALTLLGSVGDQPDDPADRRLNVPVYLGSDGDDEEWRSGFGSSLEAGRLADRSTFSSWLGSSQPAAIPIEHAEAVVRVLNETRLALAARLGIDVAADYDSIDEIDRQALDYLGWLLEELTEALSSTF